MKLFLSFAAVSALAAIPSQAALLALYDINGTTYGAAAAPSDVNPALTATSIISDTTGSGPGNFAVSNSSNTAFLQYSQAAGNLADAITGQDYLQVSITVPAGSTASFSSLDLTFRTDTAGVNSSLALFVSTDGFATAPVAGDVVDTGTTNVVTASTKSFDLTGIPAYQDIDTPTTLTFRIYGYDDSNAGAYTRVESFTINGVAVPEPAALLMGLAALPLMLRRRR